MQPHLKSDAQWRSELDELTYLVTRQGATEAPFSGEYCQQWQAGRYHCRCCGHELFSSSSKFDAGCGWPSFWSETTEANIRRLPDYSHGMVRVELRCSQCDAHLGHVFPDGPPPTGERYCINSVSLQFTPLPDEY